MACEYGQFEWKREAKKPNSEADHSLLWTGEMNL